MTRQGTVGLCLAFALATLAGVESYGQAAAPAPATPPTLVPPPITTEAQMKTIFDEFFTIGLELERPLAVSGLRIKRDTFELTLVQGTIYLAKPVAGQITGAYFTGSATMKVTLPNAYDRKRLTAAYGKPEIGAQLSELVLRFDDGTEKEILAAGKPGSAAPGDPAATWNDRLKVDFNSLPLQMDFLNTRTNGLKHTTFFLADMKLTDGKTWYGFLHDGSERIENGFYRERLMGSSGKRWWEMVSTFHRPEDYDAKGNYDLMPESDSKEIAAVRHVEMAIDIPTTKSLLIDARLTVEALRDGVSAVRFDLVNNIDAATWSEKGRPVTLTQVAGADGTALPYLHRWNQLLVLLPRPLTKGEKAVVQVKATEDTIIQLTERSYWIYTTYPWFPQIGYLGGRYTVDWTVKIAKPLRAAGTGDIVREWSEGNMNCARWKSETPVRFASFIMGDFKVSEGAYKREPPLTGEVPMRLYTVQGGEEHFKGNPKNVLDNIALGIKTYETLLGPFPFGQLDIAEMASALGFAQAPAGILLVSSVPVGSTTFTDEDGEITRQVVDEQGGLGKLGGGGTGDQFVFHELAHQWWGHQIGWVSGEDTWISESWAEYTAGLIIDAIDPKRFKVMRTDWKRRAVEGDPYGPISAVYRGDPVDQPGWGIRMVYNKGPYVVHMLRHWMGWEKFSKYVLTLQGKYVHTDINTDTLAREASKVMGYDMFPFFDQWIRDKGIPKVHYSWSAAADPEGKQIVTVKVRQEDEANFKILMLPVALDFGKGPPTIVQKPMLKAQAEFQLKVPTVPKAVTLDPEDTQLAIMIADDKRK